MVLKDFKLADRELYAHEARLSTPLIKVQASKYDWTKKSLSDKPPLLRSVHWLHNQVDRQGGSKYFTTMIQYGFGDLVKYFYDVDFYSDAPPDTASMKRKIVDEVLLPLFDIVHKRTGVKVDMGNVAACEDTRLCQKKQKYKFSVHIFINNIVCRAEVLKNVHEELGYPTWVDKQPYDIVGSGSRRLLRLVGATKTDGDTYMKPCSLLHPTLVHPLRCRTTS